MSSHTLFFLLVMWTNSVWMPFSKKFKCMKIWQYRIRYIYPTEIYLQIYWVMTQFNRLQITDFANFFYYYCSLIFFCQIKLMEKHMEKLITYHLLSSKKPPKTNKKIQIKTTTPPHHHHVSLDKNPWKLCTEKATLFTAILGKKFFKGLATFLCRCVHMQAHKYLLQMCLTLG